MKRLSNVLASVVVAGVGLMPAAHADDQDVIEYRQHIMKGLDEQSAILGQIVSYAVPNDDVIVHLEVLALLASTALKSFEPEVQGGEAKPEVWDEWEDFSARMNEFAENARLAADNAKKHGKEDALANILDVLSCKGCHDIYRTEPE